MIKSKMTGLWIPVEILLNTNLSDKEKIILSIIINLSKDKGYCYASNSYISSIVNISSGRVSKIINLLKKRNLIDIAIDYERNSKRVIGRKIIPKFNFENKKDISNMYKSETNNRIDFNMFYAT